MRNAILALAVTFILALAPACLASGFAIQPVPDRSTEREALLERLVDAETQFKGWNIAGAKTRLEQLVTALAHDTTPFNQAVRSRATEVVKAIDASQLRDAELKLAALIKAVRDGVMPSFADIGDTSVI